MIIQPRTRARVSARRGGGRSASRRAVSRVRARVLATPKINIGSTVVVFLSGFLFPPRFQFNFSARHVLALRPPITVPYTPAVRRPYIFTVQIVADYTIIL